MGYSNRRAVKGHRAAVHNLPDGGEASTGIVHANNVIAINLPGLSSVFGDASDMCYIGSIYGEDENSRKQNAERPRPNRVLFTPCDGTTVGVGGHLAFACTAPAAPAPAAG
jgi:hypothetical protein